MTEIHNHTIKKHGVRPEQYRRERPLDVSGIGNGSHKCTHKCKIPLASQRSDGTICRATFDTPAIPNSQVPALLGLDSLRISRAIIDLNTLRLHMCGPGDYKLDEILPPGTEHIQCVLAPYQATWWFLAENTMRLTNNNKEDS